MGRFLLHRLLQAIPTLLAILAITFLIMRAAPGGPFDEERALPPEVEANLRASYHLDAPLWEQFGRYLLNAVQGDFGPSFKYKDFSVGELLATGAPMSALVGGLALTLAVGIGVPLGAVAARRLGSRFDTALMSLAVMGQIIPTFVTGPLLAILFGLWLGWLPVAGWEPGQPLYLILPVMTLALPYIASIARLTRSSFADTLSADYIRTAKAFGLSDRQIFWRHALAPAMLPILSYLGPAAAGLVTGSVVVETVFNLPGIGRYFVQGALNRDYTLVLGVVALYGMLLVLFNLLVDMAYGWLDPKLRH